MGLADIFDKLKENAPVKLLDDAVGNIANKLFGKPASSRNRDALRAEVKAVPDPAIQTKVKEQVEREKEYVSKGETPAARSARALLIAEENKGQLARSAKNLHAIALLEGMQLKVKNGGYTEAELKKDTDEALKVLLNNKSIKTFEQKVKNRKNAKSIDDVDKSFNEHTKNLNEKLDGISAMSVFECLALKRATESINSASGPDLTTRLKNAQKILEDDNKLIDARRYALGQKLTDMEENS